MQSIIGRKAQIEVFKDAMESQQSEFIAVTGRRRVGKTFLIKKFFHNDLCFHLTGIQNQGTRTQLESFANEMAFRGHRLAATPATWLEAFAQLREYLSKIKSDRKKIVFLDELPWMDSQRSGFLQILAHFWNSWAAWEKDIILIIAGSSTSWIVKKVYNDTGGLHNRVTKRIWLEPFRLGEVEAFFEAKGIQLSRYEIALIYMAFGGIPFYINEIRLGETAAQAIQRLCFSKHALFLDEFDSLYGAIFQHPEAHMNIVRVLSQHHYGMERAELLKQAKIANSGMGTKVLQDLIATGYVHYMVPYGKKANGGQYILADFFSRFHLQFLANRKVQDWISLLETPIYRTWSGLAFEWLCHAHAEEILKALGINGIRTNISYLHLKDDSGKMTAQIDMLIDRADNALNLCEIKFAQDVFTLTQDQASNLRGKMSHLRGVLKRRKSIFPILITPFGCEQNKHYLGLVTRDLGLEDLF